MRRGWRAAVWRGVVTRAGTPAVPSRSRPALSRSAARAAAPPAPHRRGHKSAGAPASLDRPPPPRRLNRTPRAASGRAAPPPRPHAPLRHARAARHPRRGLSLARLAPSLVPSPLTRTACPLPERPFCAATGLYLDMAPGDAAGTARGVCVTPSRPRDRGCCAAPHTHRSDAVPRAQSAGHLASRAAQAHAGGVGSHAVAPPLPRPRCTSALHASSLSALSSFLTTVFAGHDPLRPSVGPLARVLPPLEAVFSPRGGAAPLPTAAAAWVVLRFLCWAHGLQPPPLADVTRPGAASVAHLEVRAY